MPNGNGQGPAGAGSKSGRGRGFCNGSGKPGSVSQQEQPVVQQNTEAGCRGPQGCGTGMKSGNGRGNGGCGNRRG
jgi:hypothetical protein